MKTDTQKSNLNLIAFIMFFIVGLITVLLIQGEILSPTSPTVPISNSISQTNGQKNILLVGVDRVDTKSARLESLWLVMYHPETPRFFFKPIYPPPHEEAVSSYSEPHEPIPIDPRNLSKITTLDILKELNIWWNDTILIDEYATTGLLGLIEGIPSDNIESSASEVSSLPHAWDNPHDALQAQTSIYRGVCNNSNNLANQVTLFDVLAVTEDHLYSSKNQIELTTDWHRLEGWNFDIECEFPSANH
jgi:hypothetical protein